MPVLLILFYCDVLHLPRPAPHAVAELWQTIAIAATDGDGPAVVAHWGVGLERGELLGRRKRRARGFGKDGNRYAVHRGGRRTAERAGSARRRTVALWGQLRRGDRCRCRRAKRGRASAGGRSLGWLGPPAVVAAGRAPVPALQAPGATDRPATARRHLVRLAEARQELDAQPAEDVIHDALGDLDVRVLREAHRLEAGVRKLVYINLQAARRIAGSLRPPCRSSPSARRSCCLPWPW